MGRTIEQWQDQIRTLARDAGVDLTAAQISDGGLVPALNLFSIDRPRDLVVEQAGTGSAYLLLPTGWVSGFSQMSWIEYPARQNPPRLLDSKAWTLTRAPSDVTLERVLLIDAVPSASEWVRFGFTATWPTPTEVASVDQIDDVAFHAVCSLAAANCLQHLAAETARGRTGALPTNFVDGAQRTRDLRDVAKDLRAVYDRFLGRVNSADTSNSGPGPVSIPFDYDPGYLSLFHGRRR